MKNRPAWLATAAAIAALVIGCSVLAPGQAPTGQPPGFTFALIGDLGYEPHEEPWVDNVFADLNRTPSLAFAVHVGDLSSPRYGCTDALLDRRLAQFRASAHPVVYTPGDNDWTDCHDPAVKGGNPMERLAKVRALFFQGDQALGRRTIALTRQSQSAEFSKYRENVRWDLGGVTFLTLHVPGSNNGLGKPTPDADKEFAERNRANLAWLQQGFAHAKAGNRRAVMVLQQANLFPEFSPFPGNPKEVGGFTDLRAQLQKESAAFGKPVVLVNGDSHYFRIDKPLSPMRTRGAITVPALEHFTRVETFGTPYHHWVQVTVDPNEPNVFVFQPRLVAANLTPKR